MVPTTTPWGSSSTSAGLSIWISNSKIVPTTALPGSSSTYQKGALSRHSHRRSNHCPAGQFFHPGIYPQSISNRMKFQPLPRRTVLPPDFVAPRHQCGSRAPFASGPPSRPSLMPRRNSQPATHRIPAPTSTPGTESARAVLAWQRQHQSRSVLGIQTGCTRSWRHYGRFHFSRLSKIDAACISVGLPQPRRAILPPLNCRGHQPLPLGAVLPPRYLGKTPHHLYDVPTTTPKGSSSTLGFTGSIEVYPSQFQPLPRRTVLPPLARRH